LFVVFCVAELRGRCDWYRSKLKFRDAAQYAAHAVIARASAAALLPIHAARSKFIRTAKMEKASLLEAKAAVTASEDVEISLRRLAHSQGNSQFFHDQSFV